MEPIIRKATDADGEQIIAILNHYIIHSMAAYPSTPIPPQAWERFKSMCRPECLWAMEMDGAVIGFGMLKWYMGQGSFDHSADVGYFILPEYVGKGLGKKFLLHMEQEARQMGITVMVANVSSQNPASLRFQQAMGYAECGRIPAVGIKHGQTFDIVWFYKNL